MFGQVFVAVQTAECCWPKIFREKTSSSFIAQIYARHENIEGGSFIPTLAAILRRFYSYVSPPTFANCRMKWQDGGKTGRTSKWYTKSCAALVYINVFNNT
ncbi:hypothetical protein EB796_017242 [Bugula neritina]|uniref:Uncharacterized protein n=1 Tax=Bugula neritina TaxID=10212 RepID=A0A7J7JDT1_BUGNE|nr:hypothetical protein EB796_017242 [Bugula neritina]